MPDNKFPHVFPPPPPEPDDPGRVVPDSDFPEGPVPGSYYPQSDFPADSIPGNETPDNSSPNDPGGVVPNSAGPVGGAVPHSGISGSRASVSWSTLSRSDLPLGTRIFAGMLGVIGIFYLLVMLFSLCTLNFVAPLASPPQTSVTSSLQPDSIGAYPGPVTGSTSTDPAGTNILSSLAASVLANIVAAISGALIGLIIVLTIFALAHLYTALSIYQLQPWGVAAAFGIEVLNILLAIIRGVTAHNGVLFFGEIYIPVLLVIYIFAVPSVRNALIDYSKSFRSI